VGPFGNRRGYLPDFYLPESSLWVEVKGEASKVDAELMVRAANLIHGLPLTMKGKGSCGLVEKRLLILGPIPRNPCVQDALALVGGEVVAHQAVIASCVRRGSQHHQFLPIGGTNATGPDVLVGNLLGFAEGDSRPQITLCQHVQDAYRAARMARFEHGESGAPTRALSSRPNPDPVDAVAELARFVESRCVRGADAETRPVTFRSAYSAWCEARKVAVVSTKDLTTELRRFGVTLSKGRRPRVYLGISLREAARPPGRCRRCVSGELHHLEPSCDRPEQGSAAHTLSDVVATVTR
jgi:hypothetical protein